jgi:hypothetical protein
MTRTNPVYAPVTSSLNRNKGYYTTFLRVVKPFFVFSCAFGSRERFSPFDKRPEMH